ncbi:transcription repressor NadR [Salisediminibacterium beveridgei]|uniref:Transcriptional repressor for NAD biosynthesis n=1 Tax=Salisediminibacterium beveridgei TaxID=632773 RepID=A0A1D7QYC7_9BACI|nr:transcription repressor NadR [Salisediminibacterium beveridgei]AOM84010.1 Transcriptional repressor for NAD biosynthesis [Salisediminibacterium beveridgei]
MKLTARERRNDMIRLLQKQKEAPISGSQLANHFSVSRQVVVQDMSLLKAGGHPVLATSQGYVWRGAPNNQQYERIVVCQHRPEESEQELTLLVDHGITVKDVMIEHPVYGELTGQLMVKSRKDVERFVSQMNSAQASYLSELTDGIHMHTLEADSEDDFDAAAKALEQAGFLVTSDS